MTDPRPYARFRSDSIGPYAGVIDGPVWTFPQICEAYDWPTDLTGGGVIAIIELVGGYYLSDVAKACAVNDIPIPFLTDITVPGSFYDSYYFSFGNHPGFNINADAENALDIQAAAAAYSVATGGQQATIRVYFCERTLAGIADGIRAAAADGCDVCTISYGAPEDVWEAYFGTVHIDDLEAAATEATAAGMVIFAASGDTDSGSGFPGSNVDLPAACPHIIGCGGTTKTTTTEVVWNNEDPYAPLGTGGGYSSHFPPQPWQLGVPTPPGYTDYLGHVGNGRMVPDMAANSDPNTGYWITLYGGLFSIGGTSAASPLLAGLFAAFGTKLGFITPTLYEHPECFTDITVGNNGAYSAGVGPDPCTGLGVPIGTNLAALFAAPTGGFIPPPQVPPAGGYPNGFGVAEFSFDPAGVFGAFFGDPSAPTYFVVPGYCNFLIFDAVGGGAPFATDLGEADFTYLPFGAPGRVTGLLPVTPNETLTLVIAPGGTPGYGGSPGFPGGLIYRGDTLLVAVGGAGGFGGNSGPSSVLTGEGWPAPGGGLVGGSTGPGSYPTGGWAYTGALGGTQTAGGAGSVGSGGGWWSALHQGGVEPGPGTAGSALQGGNGGRPNFDVVGGGSAGGGGGGGGWFGAGGGNGASSGIFLPFFGFMTGIGGGGGSNWTNPDPDIGLSVIAHTRGFTGNSSVGITMTGTPYATSPAPGGDGPPYVIFTAKTFAVTPLVFAFTNKPQPQPGPPGPPLRLAGRARGLAGLGTRWLAAGDQPAPTPLG